MIRDSEDLIQSSSLVTSSFTLLSYSHYCAFILGATLGAFFGLIRLKPQVHATLLKPLFLLNYSLSLINYFRKLGITITICIFSAVGVKSPAGNNLDSVLDCVKCPPWCGHRGQADSGLSARSASASDAADTAHEMPPSDDENVRPSIRTARASTASRASAIRQRQM